ncbi:hypothetical protein [Kribbella sp. NPDC006257]|uniref:hypothetical protein n=1 Tax=Kribbella sp. NPDC006257 TaxID=3156738 RepID=UPI0033AAB7A3
MAYHWQAGRARRQAHHPAGVLRRRGAGGGGGGQRCLRDPGETPAFADNQELADRHTPRFNTFLARIRDHVAPYGGSVELEPTQEPTAYDFQIDAEGIRLDALLDPSGA